QAEDGIRDDLVTGVQTCALPIYLRIRHLKGMLGAEGVVRHVRQAERSDTVPDLVVAPILVARDQRVVRRKLKIEALAHLSACVRSEERRVGKECGCGEYR